MLKEYENATEAYHGALSIRRTLAKINPVELQLHAACETANANLTH